MPTPPEFGKRRHFSGDGCDPGKCPTDHELPYERRETLADQLKRIGDEAIERRNRPVERERSGW